jgi:2-methylcitrate dehydratase PrpD
LWQVRHEDAMSKQLHTARAAQAGLVAAQLAARGFTGPAYILEGEHGFYAALCPDPDPSAVTAGASDPWRMFETSFKPWAACRHAHAIIDAVLLLREQVTSADVASVVVRSYPDAVAFCDRPEPAITVDAKFSAQHVVAVTLLDGPPRLASFDPETIARADVAAFRECVRIEAAEPYTSAYPLHYGAEVEVTLGSGGVVSAAVRDALGDPANPVGEDAVIAKARELMAAGGMLDGPIGSVVDATHALAAGGTLDELMGHLP